MRKTLNINLGGMAFIIDENAFDLLHNYLEALKHKFSNAAERDEILNDIEARIAEMLNQLTGNNKVVVTIDNVQSVIETMGKPEDIAGDEPASEPSSTSATSTQSPPVKKRLFRDPDDAKVGGVISGLCHYFGISDPVWARIAVLLLVFFSAGSVILLYFLLLIVIPKANTAAEKLQMKGEPVNINTIEKEIKDAASRASESVHSLIKNGNFFERIWAIIAGIFKVFIKIFALVEIVASMACLIAIVSFFIGFYVLKTSPYHQASHLLVDSSLTVAFFSFGYLLFFATPFIALVYLGLKILLGQRSGVRWLKPALFISWFAGLILLGMGTGRVVSNFRQQATIKNTSVFTRQPVYSTCRLNRQHIYQ